MISKDGVTLENSYTLFSRFLFACSYLDLLKMQCLLSGFLITLKFITKLDYFVNGLGKLLKIGNYVFFKATSLVHCLM